MNNIITTQFDRTSLYLVAIYMIHGTLLHVISMHPHLDGAKLNWNIVTINISNDMERYILGQGSNDSRTDARNTSNIIPYEIAKWSDADTDHNLIRQESTMTNELSYQPVFSTTCYSKLSESETSSVGVMTCGSTILKNMSPALLGIILGCIVFSLTDNINIV